MVKFLSKPVWYPDVNPVVVLAPLSVPLYRFEDGDGRPNRVEIAELKERASALRRIVAVPAAGALPGATAASHWVALLPSSEFKVGDVVPVDGNAHHLLLSMPCRTLVE